MVSVFTCGAPHMEFAVGQQWSYAAEPGLETSRIAIGALVEFEGGQRVACCTVYGALQRQPDGTLLRVTIPFLPMTVEALGRTVVARDVDAEPAAAFAEHFAAWYEDPRGASYFTVSFEGSLDRMIARQMAEIVGGEG